MKKPKFKKSYKISEEHSKAIVDRNPIKIITTSEKENNDKGNSK